MSARASSLKPSQGLRHIAAIAAVADADIGVTRPGTNVNESTSTSWANTCTHRSVRRVGYETKSRRSPRHQVTTTSSSSSVIAASGSARCWRFSSAFAPKNGNPTARGRRNVLSLCNFRRSYSGTRISAKDFSR
eukprot:TRINITY_DN8354_c0_g1_i2.p2 TRINITY_DN8354_c0_g1~~TRINITY_DN8354_c0_g1_i2.p2  ORF type:complete len:134 (+),score=22.10 TRINITY_DN8354_c0_g1_i2:1250-1651(+)